MENNATKVASQRDEPEMRVKSLLSPFIKISSIKGRPNMGHIDKNNEKEPIQRGDLLR
jgi:hypothetical protein